MDVTWIRQRCHDTPEVLHELLQKEIDAIESGEDFHTNKLGIAGNEDENTFDAILLGYGLCANATAGLCAKRHKLVIPRAHDCITLLLGPKERYQECFEAFPGCYWYTASWIENSDMPGEEYQKKQEAYYRNQDYDEDTLDYLLEELDSWTQNYKDAAYIRMPFFDKRNTRILQSRRLRIITGDSICWKERWSLWSALFLENGMGRNFWCWSRVKRQKCLISQML